MRILMARTWSEREQAALRRLEASGHDVVTCADAQPGSWTCSLLRGDRCPLDLRKVDVAVHVERPEPLSLDDEPVLCALRHFVPVVAVLAEDGRQTKLGELVAASCALDDIEPALVAAAAAPLSAQSRAAEVAANRRAVAGDTTWRGAVTRSSGRLRVELTSDEPVSRELRSRVAIRAADAVREVDQVSPFLDVVVIAPRA